MTDGFEARKMRAGDGAAVVALWETFLPPGEDWETWLPAMLDHLVGARIINAGVVMSTADEPRCLAAGISCFLPDAIAEEYIAQPRPYLNRRLLTRYRDGDNSVFLTPEEQMPGNTGEGLTMFVLEYCQETFDFGDPFAHRLLNAIVPVYISAHQGFNIRRSMHETEIAVGHVQEAGGNRKIFDVSPQDPASMASQGRGPRAVYGVSRDQLSPHEATGIARSILFSPPPRFELTLREQEVVLLALEGMTDAEIAQRIGVSRDRVKQIWGQIYAYLEGEAPDFFGEIAAPTSGVKRGGEKRRATVTFLGQNPQELRPRTLRRN